MRAKYSAKAALMMGAAALWAIPATAQEAVTDLDAVTLGKSKREIATDTATLQTTVDQTEMDDRQAGTIGELVDSVPGVTLINGTTPQGSGINIRGFGSNATFGSDQKVLIQVDGANVGGEEIYRIGTQLYTDPQLYKEVTVIRGMAGTFEYGAGAIGGMVRLETKDASDFTGGVPGFKLRQTLQFSTNGDGVSSSTIMAWQPTEDFEVLGNYTYSTQEDQVDGAGAVIGNSAFGNPSWNIKARKTFGNGDHSLTFSIADTQSDQNDVPYNDRSATTDFFGNVDRDIHTRAATLAYNYNPADNDLIDVDVSLSYSDQNIQNTYLDGTSALQGATPYAAFCANPFFGVVCADIRDEITTFTVKNTAIFDTGNVSHNLRAGIEFKRKERNDRIDQNAAPGGLDNQIALFVVDDMKIGERFTFSPAIRLVKQDIENADGSSSWSNDAVMGGISAHYKFDNGFAIFGSAAYTEGMPIIDDTGNPALMTQSEKASTIELGFSYDNLDVFTPGDDLSFKFNAYKTKIWDITSYSGVTDAEMKGLELEAAYSLSNGFYTDLNANIQRGYNTTPGAASDFWAGTPADQVRLTVGKKWDEEFDLSWEVVANRKMTRSSSPSDSHITHNLRATYRPQQGVLEGAELRIGVENLFDLDYRPHLATKQAPGRTIKFTIAKTF